MVLQGKVARLDLAQHAVELVNQCADFVVARLGYPDVVALLRDHIARRTRKVRERRGDLILHAQAEDHRDRCRTDGQQVDEQHFETELDPGLGEPHFDLEFAHVLARDRDRPRQKEP